MAFKTYELDGMGEVSVYKRRGAKNIRLSVTTKGTVRATIPTWLPYNSGLVFAKQRHDWIKQQQSKHSDILNDRSGIGKSHRLVFVHNPKLNSVTGRLRPNVIQINSPLPIESKEVQTKIVSFSERALKLEAQKLLPQRLETLASKHNFSYRSVAIKKLSSRWGSCSSKQDIALSYYLTQLPWDLIDYVVLHELVHTKHMHHGKDFWDELISIAPSSKTLRKRLGAYQPKIITTN